MASFATWRGTAQSSGAAGLAAITDGTSSTDPSGTDCNKAYWEARAYDQLNAILTSLSSDPGSGVDGNFTINIDATGNANSSLLFGSGGTISGGEPNLSWSSSGSNFTLSHNLISAIDLGSSSVRISKLWATNADISGTLTLGGSSTLTSTGSASFSSLSVSSLTLAGNIATEGVSLTFNNDYSGSSPSEDASIIVERGSQTNATLKFTESSDRWQIYDLGSSAYKDIAIFDTNGFTYTDIFAGSGGNFGTSNKVARSDHNHSFGSVGASGTESTTWDVDSDYSSGSSNIEVRFGGSARYMRINPNDSTPLFSFSHGLTVAALTVTTGITFSGSGAVTGDLPLTGDEMTFLSSNSGTPTSNADLVVNRGSGTDTRIRWNETDDRWTFTNDGSTYFRLIGTDGSDNLTAPANLTITGDIVGSLTSQGSYSTLRNDETSGGDGFYRVKTGSSTYASLKWVNSSSKWQVGNGSSFSDIITDSGTQTLTNKTLTTPSINQPTITNAGSWSGNPTFSGAPNFTGTPTFVAATFSGRPSFNADNTGAPFSVPSSPVVVTNLNADKVDGRNVNDSATGTSDLWTASKIQTQINAASSTPGAHASTHLVGASDPITGVMAITGTNQESFQLSTASATTARLDFGTNTKYRIQIKDTNVFSLGGTSVAIVPHSTSQSLGNSSNRWDDLYVTKNANFSLIGSASYPTANGSLWMASASGGDLSSLYIRLNGSNIQVVDSAGSLGSGVAVTSDNLSTGNLTFGSTGTNHEFTFKGGIGAETKWEWYSSGSLDKLHYAKRFAPPSGSAYAVMHINASSELASPGYNLIVSGTIQHSGIYQSSDSRLKDNVANVSSALDSVSKLQGVTFNWKANESLGFEVPAGGQGKQYGFIAQSVESVLPDIVDGEGDDIKSLKYDALIPVMVEAIKELKAEIQALKGS